jgi:hypothetical protein
MLLLLLTREKIRFNYLLLVAAAAAAAVSAVAVSVDDSLTFVACDTGRSNCKHENNNKRAALRTKTTTKPHDATMRHDENQH